MNIIQNNLLPNVKITVKDIYHAECIYGKELGTVHGKTTRMHPDRVITDHPSLDPDILKFHGEVTLAMDIMHIGDLQFLLTLSRNIQFTTVDKLESKSQTKLEMGLNKVVNLFYRRGFKITIADNEFDCIREYLQGRQINLNICGPNEHLPEVERMIRTVKERVRGILTTLPFKIGTLRNFFRYFFPPNGGISETFSPQAIITRLTPDFSTHCKAPF